ncbi:unnamed protein product [Withania somnifera]
MDVDLTPKLAKKVYDGDGGSYHSWCPTELPMLKEGNIGAAKLTLSKNGFALPRYFDSAKVAYVLQGCGVARIVIPGKDEKVVPIKKGDTISLPFGIVSWWYNKEDTELVVLFLGDTKTTHKAGSFTDMYLTGSNGIFTDFSTEFVSRAWDVEESIAKTLILIFKGGGKVVVLNTKNLPLVGDVGTSAGLVMLSRSAMCSPGFSVDLALQVTYIVKGIFLTHTSKLVIFFIIPRFCVVSKISDPDGLEWFSIITTPNPKFTNLAGNDAPWKFMSPQVL